MVQSHRVGKSSSCEERVMTVQATLPKKLCEINTYSLLLKDFQIPDGRAG